MLRVVLWQVGCAIIIGSLFWIFRNAAAAWSGFCGGSIPAVGSALLGWRMFAPGVAPPATLQRSMLAGESLKWCWYVAALWLAFARFKLLPAPLMTGLVIAQFGYWAGLVGTKRGKLNGGV